MRATCRTAEIYDELGHHKIYRAPLVEVLQNQMAVLQWLRVKSHSMVSEDIVLDWQQTVSAPMPTGYTLFQITMSLGFATILCDLTVRLAVRCAQLRLLFPRHTAG